MSKERKIENMMEECQAIEALMFLKHDELSIIEASVLNNHLRQCKDCQKKYQDIKSHISEITFNPVVNLNPDEKDKIEKYVQNRIVSLIIKKKNNNTIFFKRALVAASILFFVFFSTEQIRTISKITNLEQRVEETTNLSVVNRHKREILVLNHFFTWKELVSVGYNSMGSMKIESTGILRPLLKYNKFSLRKLSIIENQDAIISLIGNSRFTKYMHKRFESILLFNANPQ